MGMDWITALGRIGKRQYSASREEARVPKGYVPLLVGNDGGSDGGDDDNKDKERILIQVRLLTEERISALLEVAGQEFGYKQQGILRIPCEPEHFRQIVSEIS